VEAGSSEHTQAGGGLLHSGSCSHPVTLQTRAAPRQNCPSHGLEEKKGMHLLSIITQFASLNIVFFPLTTAFGAFS